MLQKMKENSIMKKGVRKDQLGGERFTMNGECVAMAHCSLLLIY